MVCRYKCPHLHQAAPVITISYAKAMVCRCPHLHQTEPAKTISYAKEDLCIPLPAYHYFTYHYYFLNPYKPLNTNYVFIQKNKNYTLKIDNRLTN